jgi:N-acetylmuramoyl-L-alanine amidase
MLQSILNAIRSFFASLFGSKKSTNTSTPRPQPSTTAENRIPQDASEVPTDSLVVVANEMDEVILPVDVSDQDFDEDVKVEDAKKITADSPVAPQPPTLTPVSPAPETDIPRHQPRYLWCLDNGHGKRTAGKRSPVFDDGITRFFEYEFNRDIVKRIIEQLEKIGVQYFNVVPEVDTDDFLEGRVNRANRKQSDLPKLFVSVHSNAAPTAPGSAWGPPTVSGIETWFYHSSRRGRKLAAVFHKYLIEETGFRNRHLKSKPEGQFYVLRKTAMTSILTENGFYNNKKEAIELMKDEVRQQIADAHVKAILEVEKEGL